MSHTENKMGIVPVPRLMLHMGMPMIASMVVQAFYNIVDTYFISHITSSTIPNIGDYAIHALTLAFPIQMLMVAIGVGTGVGVNALLSKYLGERKYEEAAWIAGNAIFLSLCTYVVFLFFGLFLAKGYLATQTSNEIVLSMGYSYLRICCILSFGSICSMIYEKLLQGTGKTTYSTIAQLAGALTNIVLDPILIFGYFGLPALGVNGAAWATVIGQILTLGIDVGFHYVKNTEIKSSLSYLRPKRIVIKDIYKIGIPAIIMQSLLSIMSYSINIIFGLVSASAVTAFGVYYKIQQFVFFAAFGMNNAMIPIISYNFGKQDKQRIKDGIYFGTLYTVLLTLLGTIVLQLFATQLVHTFGLIGDTARLCILALHIVTIGYVFAGLNISFQGVFQALGNGVRSLIVSLIRLILVPLPLAWVFTHVSNAPFWIWFCFPIAEGLATVVALYYYQTTRKEHKLL